MHGPALVPALRALGICAVLSHLQAKSRKRQRWSGVQSMASIQTRVVRVSPFNAACTCSLEPRDERILQGLTTVIERTMKRRMLHMNKCIGFLRVT